MKNLILISVLLLLSSCNTHYGKKDISNKFVFSDKKPNDIVDFKISEIRILNTKFPKGTTWSEHGITMRLSFCITNLSNNYIYIPFDNLSDSYKGPNLSYIIRNDTIGILYYSDKRYILSPHETDTIVLKNGFPAISYLETYIANYKINEDNTDKVIDLIKELKFYYSPLNIDEEVPLSDTILLCPKIEIRPYSKTKVYTVNYKNFSKFEYYP